MNSLGRIIITIVAVILVLVLAGWAVAQIRQTGSRLASNPTRLLPSPTPTPDELTPTPTPYSAMNLTLTPTPVLKSGTKGKLPVTGINLFIPLAASAGLGIFGWYLARKEA